MDRVVGPDRSGPKVSNYRGTPKHCMFLSFSRANFDNAHRKKDKKRSRPNRAEQTELNRTEMNRKLSVTVTVNSHL